MGEFLDALVGLGLKALDDKFDGKISDFLYKESDKRDRNRDRILALAKSMENKSDDELKRIYQTSSGDRKIAAAYLLKQRGY